MNFIDRGGLFTGDRAGPGTVAEHVFDSFVMSRYSCRPSQRLDQSTSPWLIDLDWVRVKPPRNMVGGLPVMEKKP